MERKTVLIVEDEKSIVDILRFNLQKEGYRTLEAYDGAAGLKLALEENPDLILLDLMLPAMNGFEVCKTIRDKGYSTPVLIITAREAEKDKILGLDLGADDYITKPFNPVEVAARVRSQLRRYFQLGGGALRPEVLTLGTIQMDDREKTVAVDGDPVALTPTEYDILKLLLEHPGQVFSPREIYRKVWKDAPFGSENTVAVHIRHLREKIEIDPAEPRYLKVVWGQGYKLEKGMRT